MDLQGRVFVVTGPTGGIGRATAEALAKRGATLALVARDPKRGAALRDALAVATGNRDVHFFQSDLSELAQVRRVAAEVQARFPAVHVLVNNAGVYQRKREVTVDGLEKTFAVNVAAPFLLAHLLHPALRAGARARVVNVASRAEYWSELDLDDLQWQRRRYVGWTVYGTSKRALLLLTYELARRWQGTGVAVHALHPGVVRTNLGSAGGGASAIGWLAATPFLRSPAQGATASLYAATSPALEGKTGRYVVDEREAHSSRASQDPALAARLWERVARLTGV